MLKENWQKLLDLCGGGPIYIQTHNFPDPDAIGSAFGLQKLFAVYGVPSVLCYDGRIDKLSASRMLDLLDIEMRSYDDIRDGMKESDLILCVDAQKLSGNVTDFVGDEFACIDHHPTFKKIDYRYSDIRIVGACSTLIAEYYYELGVEPDSDTATALLYGLKMDTLQFTRGVTDLDIRMFEYLFAICDQEKLTALERNSMEFNDLQAYGAAIESIEIYDKVGFSYINFPCPDALIAILSDFILALVEVEVAIVFAFRGDGIKFSVRSEDPRIHAGEILNRTLKDIGSGGGHATMGGGMIPADRVPELGNHPREAIRNMFLETLGKN